MTSPKDIGRRIELRRKELGLTLKEVADRACVSLSTISRYERGEFDRIKLPVVMAIANALGVSHDYIVCKIDTPFSDISPSEPTNSDSELSEYLELLRSRPECRMLFSLAKGATKEDVEKAVAIIEALRKTEGKA